MGRTKFYESVEEMQKDLDGYLIKYNTKRPHQGRGMNGRTPEVMFKDGLKKKKRNEKEKEVESAA